MTIPTKPTALKAPDSCAFWSKRLKRIGAGHSFPRMLGRLPLLLLLAIIGVQASRAAEESPPNVVFILSDDQGWGDYGFMGHPRIETPCLDRLAAESLTFNARIRADEPVLSLAKYWAMCEWFDETCGQWLDHLDAQGLGDNTLVVYVCDNGWIQEKESSDFAERSKRSPYDGGLRTPIMVRWRGKVEPARVATPVSSIDLVPTALAACGLRAAACGLRAAGWRATFPTYRASTEWISARCGRGRRFSATATGTTRSLSMCPPKT